MKSTIIYSGTIVLLLLFLVSCDNQSTRTAEMGDIKEEMNEVIQTIDEALIAEDISEFKNKTDDAISKLDNKVDDYLDELDNADRRIDGSARNQIIDIKQKKVEVEFKLALLEQDDYDWDNNEYRNRTGTTTDTRTGTNNMDRTTTTDTRTGTDQTDIDDVNRGTDNNRVATDDQRDRTGTYRTHREIMYGPELVEDLKSDLRDLRSQVEQLAQTLPGSYEDNRSSMR
jgi:hypothetical protein